MMNTGMIREHVERLLCCLLLTMAVVIVHGCGGAAVVPPGGSENGGPSNGEDVSFAADIAPILLGTCDGCHAPNGTADLEGIDLRLTPDVSFEMLTTLQSVQDPALMFVVPGDPNASLLFLKVSSNNPPVGVRMPRSLPPLSADEVELIRLWIEQGALDN